MTDPVHTAPCKLRASGAPTVLVGVQVLVAGLYRAPAVVPPPLHAIISVPVHTAEPPFVENAPVVLTGSQVFVAGSYFPVLPEVPPHTSIHVPVQSAVWLDRGPGRL